MQQHTLQTIICIIEHIPRTLCAEHYVYICTMQCDPPKNHISYKYIYALLQPTYAGGIQNSNFLQITMGI